MPADILRRAARTAAVALAAAAAAALVLLAAARLRGPIVVDMNAESAAPRPDGILSAGACRRPDVRVVVRPR